MKYRLKVNYRGHWKYAKTGHDSLESAVASKNKLAAMGVKSIVCDSTGKEVNV